MRPNRTLIGSLSLAPLLLVAWSSAVALANDTTTGASASTLPLPHPKTILLHSEVVQRELQLDKSQRGEVSELLASVDYQLWRLRDQPQAKRQELAMPLLRRLDAQLAKTLSDEQLLRFHQILRQSYGFNILRLSDVIQELSLSEQQLADIDAKIDEHFEQAREMAASGRTNTAEANRLQERTRQTLMDLLDEPQQQTLAKLVGAVIDLSSVKQVACLAPELRGVDQWLQSEPLTLQSLRGKVVVVHFYTHICINCVRNLPHYNQWREAFPADKFQIIGIHRPEFDHDRDPAGILRAAEEAGVTYPIAVDNQSQNWNAWANNMWPSVYLIDKQGYLRRWWYGELTWQGATGDQQMANQIQQLIDE